MESEPTSIPVLTNKKLFLTFCHDQRNLRNMHPNLLHLFQHQLLWSLRIHQICRCPVNSLWLIILKNRFYSTLTIYKGCLHSIHALTLTSVSISSSSLDYSTYSLLHNSAFCCYSSVCIYTTFIMISNLYVDKPLTCYYYWQTKQWHSSSIIIILYNVMHCMYPKDNTCRSSK